MKKPLHVTELLLSLLVKHAYAHMPNIHSNYMIIYAEFTCDIAGHMHKCVFVSEITSQCVMTK